MNSDIIDINPVIVSTDPILNNIMNPAPPMRTLLKSGTSIPWKTILIGILILSIVIIILVKKIPILCYGCESPQGAAKLIFRCVNDTSPDSKSCQVSNEFESKLTEIEGEIDEVKVWVQSAFSTVSSVPKMLQDKFFEIVKYVKDMTKVVVERLTTFYENFTDWVKTAFEYVKQSIINTYKEFDEYILQPIIKFVTTYIINPVTDAINYVVELKDTIIEIIKAAGSQFGNTLLTFKKNAIDAIVSIPTTVIGWVNDIIDKINMLTGYTNQGISTVIQTANKAIETINSTEQVIDDLGTNIIGGAVDTINEITGFARYFGWNIQPIEKTPLDLPTIPTFADTKNAIPTIGYLDAGSIEDTLTKSLKSAVDTVSGAISEAVKFVFSPLNNIIQYLATAVGGLVASITNLFSGKGTFFQDLYNNFKNGAKLIFQDAVDFVVNNIIRPLADGLNSIKDYIQTGLQNIIDVVFNFLVNVKEQLEVVFKNVTSMLVEFGKYVFKNGLYVLFFSFAKFVDTIIPFKIPITTKITIVLLLLAFLFYVVVIIPFMLYITSPYFKYGAIFLLIILAILIIPSLLKKQPPTQQERIRSHNQEVSKNAALKQASLSTTPLSTASSSTASLSTATVFPQATVAPLPSIFIQPAFKLTIPVFSSSSNSMDTSLMSLSSSTSINTKEDENSILKANIIRPFYNKASSSSKLSNPIDINVKLNQDENSILKSNIMRPFYKTSSNSKMLENTNNVTKQVEVCS